MRSRATLGVLLLAMFASISCTGQAGAIADACGGITIRPSCLNDPASSGPSPVVRLNLEGTNEPSPVSVQMTNINITQTNGGKMYSYTFRSLLAQHTSSGASATLYKSNHAATADDLITSGNVSAGSEALFDGGGALRPYTPFKYVVVRAYWGVSGIGWVYATGSFEVPDR